MSVKNLIMSAAGASTGNPNAWDVSKAVYDAGPNPGQLSGTSGAFNPTGLNKTFADSSPYYDGAFVSEDGTRAYVVGMGDRTVYQHSLSTPWDIRTASYASNSFSVASQATNPQGLFLKSDGTKMYVVDVNTLFQYSLSTAWDVSTASYDSVSFALNTATGITDFEDIYFRSDGLKMYALAISTQKVYEFDLSSAWDISTLSYLQASPSATPDGLCYGLSFTSDGTQLYVTGDINDRLYRYVLSTPWDITTASQSQSVAINATAISVCMKPDGSMFFIFTQSTAVFQYLTGAFNVATQETTPTGLFFKPDGTKMYIIGNVGDDVNEYDLSTAWDITTASYLQNFSVAGQETGPSDLFFKEDGTKMYVVGTSGDDVNEYDLSTGWDVSSASYVQNFSVASQETVPNGVFFKTDGTKMYIVGAGDIVYQYSLSTAWNLSTASYDSVSFSVSAQETNPHTLSFKPDGTKMYILGQNDDDINEYNLSTPWDISSASYVQNLPVLENGPTGLYWRDNGEEFFIVGSAGDRVQKYAIPSE
jgi:sugar lactone lactonase YvrE